MYSINDITINSKVQGIKGHNIEFPNPIVSQKDEELEFIKTDNKGWYLCRNKNGEEAWFPKNYLKLQSGKYIMKQDYTNKEYNITIGEKGLVKIIESGWVWVEMENGHSGWVPLECLKKI